MYKASMTAGLVLAMVTAAGAAELRMAWGEVADPSEQILELEVGDTALIDIYVTLTAGDTLSTVFFENENASQLSQIDVLAELVGWDAGGQDGTLGVGGQQFAVAAHLPLQDSVAGPAEYLIGSQVIQVLSGSPGNEFEIAFDTAGLGLLESDGSSFTLRATGNPNQDLPGNFHLGVGSPGYTLGPFTDERDPLIVLIVDSSIPGGNENDNGDDNDNENENLNDNGNVNDNANLNENLNENANDNANANENLNENTNANENGNDNANENNNANANQNQNQNQNQNLNVNDNQSSNVNQNANTGGNTNDNGSSNPDPQPPRRMCGLGAIGFLPAALFGLLLLQAGRRRASHD